MKLLDSSIKAKILQTRKKPLFLTCSKVTVPMLFILTPFTAHSIDDFHCPHKQCLIAVVSNNNVDDDCLTITEEWSNTKQVECGGRYHLEEAIVQSPHVSVFQNARLDLLCRVVNYVHNWYGSHILRIIVTLHF